MIPQDVLEEAWEYAQKPAILRPAGVPSMGKLQFERYDRGANSRTPYNSQSLHKSLTAVMLGAAIYNGAIEIRAPAGLVLAGGVGGRSAALRHQPLRTWPTWKAAWSGAASPSVRLPPARGCFLTGHLAREALGTPHGCRTGRRVHLVQRQRAGAFHRDRKGRRARPWGATAARLDLGADRGRARPGSPARPPGGQCAIVLLPYIQRAQLAAHRRTAGRRTASGRAVACCPRAGSAE